MLEANVAINLRQTNQRIKQIMREKVGEYGLTLRLLHIIMLVEKNPDMNQKELSEQMRLTEGAMSGSIKRLIELSMLQQVPLEKDLRYNRLVITEHGRSVIAECEEHLYNRYRELFIGFKEEELWEFNAALLKINANLDQMESQTRK